MIRILILSGIFMIMLMGCTKSSSNSDKAVVDEISNDKEFTALYEKDKVIYSLDITLPNYCYEVKQQNITVDKRRSIIIVDMIRTLKKGMCAQSLKMITLSSQINPYDIKNIRTYQYLELNIYNKNHKKLKSFHTKIIKE